jgi:predicted permease
MNDFRFAFRQLIKNPGFTIIAVLALALGIGANSAIFSVVDTVLLRPLPYPQQERIVELRELSEIGRPMPFAEPNFADVRTRSRSFEAVANYNNWPEAVAGGSEPVRTNVCAASRDFFRVLGVRPVVGRFFSTEAKSEGSEVAVIGYSFWQRMLGGRTNLDGTSLRFANHSFAVIGVLPPGVEFPLGTDVWFPSDFLPHYESRTAHNWRALARLRDGVSKTQAAAEIASIGQQLKREYGSQTDAVSFGLVPLRERMVKDLRGVLLVLCGAVGLLLLIACSNVANLLLVRATARRKEIALRAALGASPIRLARQFVAESLALTFIASALGVVFAFWGVDLIVGLYGRNLPAIGQVGVNSSVLLFTLAVALLTGLVLGFVPALHASAHQLQAGLHEAGRGQSASRGSRRIRDSLIVSQIALTLMLLVAAGLLGRSFQRLLKVDPGFRSESAVAMTASIPRPEDAALQRRVAQIYQQLLARLEALPGVSAAGGINSLPMSGMGANGTFIEQSGSKPAETMEELHHQFDALSPVERARDAEYRAASAGYFSAMGIPLIRGRSFRESDGRDSPHLAVVSQSLVRRYWPNEDPIGKQIQFGNMDSDLRLMTVVGVVGDVRDDGLDVDIRPTIYANCVQRPAAAAQFSFVARGKGDAATLIAAMRREAAAVNPDMPVKFETLKQIVAGSLDQRRFSMVIVAAFASAALLLAMVGLYGIMAFVASERTMEIGIRMALGAQRGDVLRMILRQSFLIVLMGVGAGLAGAFGATRLLGNLVHCVEANDVTTYGAVILLLSGAALLASWIPARRAARVDPVIALRAE